MTEAGTVPTARPRSRCTTVDAVISTVQIFPKGTGNDLHTHPAQDGYWLVLGGRAKFLGEGDVMYWPTWVNTKGFMVPHGTRYHFVCDGEEPLEILRVSMNLPGPPGSRETNPPLYDAATTLPMTPLHAWRQGED